MKTPKTSKAINEIAYNYVIAQEAIHKSINLKLDMTTEYFRGNSFGIFTAATILLKLDPDSLHSFLMQQGKAEKAKKEQNK